MLSGFGWKEDHTVGIYVEGSRKDHAARDFGTGKEIWVLGVQRIILRGFRGGDWGKRIMLRGSGL